MTLFPSTAAFLAWIISEPRYRTLYNPLVKMLPITLMFECGNAVHAAINNAKTIKFLAMVEEVYFDFQTLNSTEILIALHRIYRPKDFVVVKELLRDKMCFLKTFYM